MERFRRRSTEKILLKSPIKYLKGEQTFKAIMFQGAIMDCKALLTSERFVACQERKWHMIGGLTFLIALFIPKKIVFEIPLDNLASVKFGEEKGSNELVLKTADGAEFRIELFGLGDVFGDTRDTWLKTFTEAVKNASPEMEVKSNETSAEFVRPQRADS